MKYKINSERELLDAFLKAEKHFDENVLWWRGQPVSTWDLLPRIYQRKDPSDEEDLLIDFCKKAKSRHSECPAQDDYSSWLFLMQHHHLPTRLLDWTESILIAAYFAVRREKYSSNPGALWALDPGRLNRIQFSDSFSKFVPEDEEVAPLFKQAFGLSGTKRIKKIAAVNPDEVDIRMMVQMSVFTIHGTTQPLNKIRGNEKFLMKFEIPAKVKEELSGMLFDLGIRESNLFPDLDHLAKELESLEYG